MTAVAVVAHRRKRLGDGLPALRKALEDRGVTADWYEVDRSKRVPGCVRKALEAGADLVFVWGGDGSVQRAVDALAGSEAALAILPAGTANLLANNLGVPIDLEGALDVGLRGLRRRIDLGVVNGERFAVMAGTGLDATIMGDVDRAAKERLGRVAYVRSTVKGVKASRRPMRVKVDGNVWFEGRASCVLFGNVGTVTGGLRVFPDARPDDGRIEVGVVTARSAVEWLRVLGRVVGHDPDRSPFVAVTRAERATVRLDGKARYELDGGARPKARRLRVRVDPQAVWVCVPDPARV